mgnify:CR=1 FL=1
MTDSAVWTITCGRCGVRVPQASKACPECGADRCGRPDCRALGTHTLACVHHNDGDNLRVRLAAEIGDDDDVPGWWYDDSSEPHEAVWFLDLEGGVPWSVSVYRDEPGAPWSWDVDWNPPELHTGDRTIATGEAFPAWEAMQEAKAAYDARPMPLGDPACKCHGWRTLCDHGGGPPHPCEVAGYNARVCDGCLAAPEGDEDGTVDEEPKG